MPSQDPFQFTTQELLKQLTGDQPLFPELERARERKDQLRHAPQTQMILAQTEPLMATISQIPLTPYTSYRLFRRNGDRKRYETPYFLKRERLSAAAFRLFMGAAELKDVVQDHVWNICEETNWVLPAHENSGIDLFSAETGLLLAETLTLLGDELDEEVRHRVRSEVERRIFDPYIRFHQSYWWYTGGNNWNGVCNGSVAATFLLLDPEPGRVAKALELALAGLLFFLDTAFESDGSSTEGVAYWHYGLTNVVVLSEMLYARTNGALNLLASEHMQRIAAYPPKLRLSGSSFASFSDCHETVHFNPGIITRLAQRAGEPSLLEVLAQPAALASEQWLTMMLRNVLWWDGRRPDAAQMSDSVFPVAGMARLVARTPSGAPIVLAIKAGHNAENHNQNDVGSFIVHVDGENLLTDPGPGLYSRDYFGARRYENIFANSYGHSVPRIGGHLQQAGREFHGKLVGVVTEGEVKCAEVAFQRAYPVVDLERANRQLSIIASGDDMGDITLQDEYQFTGVPSVVEEAFVTWCDVVVDGTNAVIQGQHHNLHLSIAAPEGAQFRLELLEEDSKANGMPAILKRLSFMLPVAAQVRAFVRMRIG